MTALQAIFICVIITIIAMVIAYKEGGMDGLNGKS